MNFNTIISRRIRRAFRGVDASADVNAVVSANVGEPGTVTATSSRQRIVQSSRAEARADQSSTTQGGSDDGRPGES